MTSDNANQTPPHNHAETEGSRPSPTVRSIVLAAGSGSRFGSMKQFAKLTDAERLADRSISTIRRFAAERSTEVEIVVVVNPMTTQSDRDAFITNWSDADHACIVDGGASRLDSVALGLSGLSPARSANEIVLVHDAAHPLASVDLVARLIDHLANDLQANHASGSDACVPVLDAVDMVRSTDANGDSQTIGRSGLGSAQVPMAFKRSSLTHAHQRRTDVSLPALEDSHLVELVGGRVTTVAGEVTNIHVVDAESLALARLIAAHGVERVLNLERSGNG